MPNIDNNQMKKKNYDGVTWKVPTKRRFWESVVQLKSFSTLFCIFISEEWMIECAMCILSYGRYAFKALYCIVLNFLCNWNINETLSTIHISANFENKRNVLIYRKTELSKDDGQIVIELVS